MLYIRYKIASPTYIKEHSTTADPEAMEFLATNASGTGPFKLVEFVPDQRVVFEKNAEYWGGEPGGRATPKVDRVVFQIIKDPETARIELEAGRVDIVESPPPAQFEVLRNTPGVQLTSYKIPRVAYLTVDVSKPPFDDIKIRQAVAHAVNYQELMDSGELGTAFPLCGLIPDGLMEVIPQDTSLCLYPYDVAKAKALMAESSQPSGFTLDLTYAPERNGGFPVEAQLLQAYLAEIGITANIQPLDAVAQVAKMAEGAYGIALFVWNAGIPDADDTAGWLYDQSRLPTNESWVGSFWDDTKVQGDMQKARELTDLQERAALYKAADKTAMDEAIYMPLVPGQQGLRLPRHDQEPRLHGLPSREPLGRREDPVANPAHRAGVHGAPRVRRTPACAALHRHPGRHARHLHARTRGPGGSGGAHGGPDRKRGGTRPTPRGLGPR